MPNSNRRNSIPIREALSRAILEKEKQLNDLSIELAALKDALASYEAVEKRARSAYVTEKGYDAHAYVGMKVSQAVRSYLERRGAAVYINEIVTALAQGGASLGRYPLRTVKIAVTSPSAAHMFHVRQDGYVELKATEQTRATALASRTS